MHGMAAPHRRMQERSLSRLRRARAPGGIALRRNPLSFLRYSPDRLLEPVREHIESYESLVIPWVSTIRWELADVDGRKSGSL